MTATVPGNDATSGGAVETGPPLNFADLIKRIGSQTGLKGKKLYLPIRAALTGHLHGPELDKVFALLSPSSLNKRIEQALALT